MPLFWFFSGALTALAALAVLLAWLRSSPRRASLPGVPWPASIAVVGLAALVLGYGLFARPGAQRSTPPAPSLSAAAPGAFTDAARAFKDSAATPVEAAGGQPTAAAGSMDSAVANLESRLSKGGGTDGDWELLAKSFEFLGRPADAAKARAHQMPPVPTDGSNSSATSGVAASGAAASGASARSVEGAGSAAVSGEIVLAPDLKAKAAAGQTLFIVAKSVDTPGVPVAVFRSAVGPWPLKFTLDDSQSMMPGRNLSSAGRVTIEARISQKGQPLPAPGDLQGSSGVINPADHRPLKIKIDRVIT